MKYALFIAEQNDSDKGREAFRYFLSSCKDNIGKLAGTEILNEGTFLCSLSDGLHPISTLVALSKQYKVSSRTLFFDSEPSWIIS